MSHEPPDIPLDWRNPDPVVQRIVELLERGERTVPYWWLTNKDRFGGRFATPSFAYAYAGIWAGILLGVLVSSRYWIDAATVVATLVVVGVTYRLWDIVRWWIDFVIERRHYAVLSRERNIVFLALNLLELTLVGAVLLRAADPDPTSADRWFDAFFLVTQMGLPGGEANSWERTVYVVMEVSALVLLLGGLAALISLVGAKLKEQPWHGPTGGSAG